MKTKHDLAQLILKNAEADAKALTDHAKDVAEYVVKNFPWEIPDSVLQNTIRLTESALVGKLRSPEESARIMLERCMMVLAMEERGRG